MSFVMHPQLHPLFIDYCAHFTLGDYFECHEVAEDYWKQLALGDKNHALVGYIQLAASLYHQRRGNTVGAQKLRISAERILLAADDVFFTYTDRQSLLTNASLQMQETLQQLVATRVATLPKLDEHFIKHKHTLRDRSEVIAARQPKKALPPK